MKHNITNNNHGFTILELMVATVVLSVVLMLATVTIVGVGHLYYKGQVNAHTEDVTRTVEEDISKQLQFSNNPLNIHNIFFVMPPAGYGNMGLFAQEGAFCIGNTRYYYVLNRELDPGVVDSTHAPHVLWKDTVAPGQCLSFLNLFSTTPPSATGQELLDKHMRLTALQVVPPPAGDTSATYTIRVWVAYGEDDLLLPVDANGHRYCKSGQGDQFCAVSEIDTSVTQRLR